jgi:transmembrane sensor
VSSVAAASASLPIEQHVVDQAIAWAVRRRLHAARTDESQAFEAWRIADARHEAAWQRIESMQHAIAVLPPKMAAQALAVSAQVLAARKGRRQALKLAAAGAFAGLGLYAGRDSAMLSPAFADYSTGVGRRQTVLLSDGTQLVLNTDTAVNVRYGTEQRLIDVRRGEILVITGSDGHALRHRPFMVSTSDGVMLALGTKFLVRKEDGVTRLTVLEHAVEIRTATGSPLIVNAGESYFLSRKDIWKADTVRFDPAAWTDGVIAAREMRMDRFLAELSRYRPGLLLCDPAVAALPVSGIFQLHDTDRTLDVLLATQPVAAHYRTRYWVTVIPRTVA